jgi:uncharacterized protein (TIGR00369 family)
MTKAPAADAAIEFEAEFVARLAKIFEEEIVFNQFLGLKVTSITPKRVTARVAMHRQLHGHWTHNRMHGGVIAAGLDIVGGLVTMAAIAARHMDEPPAQRIQRFGKVSTLDMRVDYLRPGSSDHFELSAEIVRLGARVASTRMEFRGADATLMATGAGAYIVS